MVPVERTMSRNKGRYTFLLDMTLALVTLMLGSFGILGYLTFGSDTEDVITLNLPGKERKSKHMFVMASTTSNFISLLLL